MGHLHRPQSVSPLVFYPVEYYYDRPQLVFGPGGSVVPPTGDTEIVEEVITVFEPLEFEEAIGVEGLVLIEDV